MTRAKHGLQIYGVRVDAELNRLSTAEASIQLEPRIMDVLIALADVDGVAARETLIDRVWNVEHGGDESLSRAISVLRKAFRELGVDGPVIETIPKRGYRLVAQTHVADESTIAFPASLAGDKRSTRPNLLQIGGVAAIALALIIVFFRPGANQADLASEPSVARTSADTVLAVMPFEALTDIPSDEIFARGISEEMLARLGLVPDVSVVARTSSFAQGADDGSLKTIGERLGATHLVTGTVQRREDEIRVTTTLSETGSGLQVWSGSHDSDASDVFALQDEIVRQIAQSLEIRLGVGRYADAQPNTSVDPVAHEFYLQGLDHFGNRMRVQGAYHAADQAYRSAVEYDPDFAEAWVGLALVNIASAAGPLARDREAFETRTRAAIESALQLTPDDPLLNAGLVFWYLNQEMDIERAKFHLDKALSIAPRSAITAGAEAEYFSFIGDAERAIAAYERGLVLDPLNLSGQMGRAIFLSQIGRHRSASDFFDSCAEENCLQEGFLAYGMMAAVFSRDDTQIRKWLAYYEPFEASWASVPIATIPKSTQVFPVFVSRSVNRPDRAERERNVIALFEQEIITDGFGVWGPTLADILPRDTFLNVLELAYERGDLLTGAFALSPYYGTNPFPEWVLRHPRYHAIWAKPELVNLAEARRSNGWEDGLPKFPVSED